MIVVAECGNDAPPKRDIEVVEVLPRDRLRAEIDGDRREDVVEEVVSDVGMLGMNRCREKVVKLIETRSE